MANGQAAAVVVVGMDAGPGCVDVVCNNPGHPGSHQSLRLGSYTINVYVV